MLSSSRRSVVVVALAVLIAISLPRYRFGVGVGDYARAGQMVALVWLGFFASARYWVKGDARFSRGLIVAAAGVCLPLLLYHAYDATGFSQTLGNVVLFAGVATYSYGVLVRGEVFKRTEP